MKIKIEIETSDTATYTFQKEIVGQIKEQVIEIIQEVTNTKDKDKGADIDIELQEK